MTPRARTAAGISVGVTGCTLATMLMVPFRTGIQSANLVLVFVGMAVAAAWIGGRAAGIVVAVVAAGVYDVFFTLPYGSLRISKRGDLISDGLLLVIALVVAVARDRQRVADSQVYDTREDMSYLFAMARAVGSGEESLGRLVGTVALLCEAEGVAACRRDGTIVTSWGAVPSRVDVELLHTLSINGWPPDEPRTLHFDEGVLPVSGALLPVYLSGRQIGYLAIYPGPDPIALSFERRHAATVAAGFVASLMAS